MSDQSKEEPLPRYRKEFDLLSEMEKKAIIDIQIIYPRYWWNPNCRKFCTGHKKVHKYSFEAYVEGFVTGYCGFDSVKEMSKEGWWR